MNGKDVLTDVEPLTDREREVLLLISRGLSNREIANELYIAVSTVKWYNKEIFNKMGVHSRTQAVVQAKRAGVFGTEVSKSTAAPVKHNLPSQVTSFIGRAKELIEIKQLLRKSRILTLTGTGGSGKTRLAITVAIDEMEQYRDGITFVDLVPITDPQLVPGIIAREFGLRETGNQTILSSLKNHLQEKRVLLLLDNCEHVIEAAPLIAEIIAELSQLRALITSREPLHIYGEQEYLVPPLAVLVEFYSASIQKLLENESVALFHQRASAVKPEFQVTNENALAVAEICVRLDGLPLGIELAAGRIKMFSPR